MGTFNSFFPWVPSGAALCVGTSDIRERNKPWLKRNMPRSQTGKRIFLESQQPNATTRCLIHEDTRRLSHTRVCHFPAPAPHAQAVFTPKHTMPMTTRASSSGDGGSQFVAAVAAAAKQQQETLTATHTDSSISTEAKATTKASSLLSKAKASSILRRRGAGARALPPALLSVQVPVLVIGCFLLTFAAPSLAAADPTTQAGGRFLFQAAAGAFGFLARGLFCCVWLVGRRRRFEATRTRNTRRAVRLACWAAAATGAQGFRELGCHSTTSSAGCLVVNFVW